MRSIRIGIIGTGQIAKRHIENYLSIEGAEIIAVSGHSNLIEMENIRSKYGIPHGYLDFRKLLKRGDIDAVDVCVHNNLHAPITIEAFKAGKHVYCEKPIAGSYHDGKAMLDAAKASGKKLHIQLSTLYSIETKCAKTLIDQDNLGHIYHAHSSGYRRRGRPFVDGYGTADFVKKEICAGGALYDVGVYHISQILFLLGNPEVDSVFGRIYQETGMDEQRKKISGYNVEELGLGFVTFKNKVSMDIVESWAVHMNEFDGSYILGSRGGIRLNPFSFHTTINDIEMDATVPLEEIELRFNRTNDNFSAYKSSQHHWICALQGKVDLLNTAEIALQTMLISEAIYFSDSTGKMTTASQVKNESKSTALNP